MSRAIVVNQAQPTLSITEKAEQMCWSRRGANRLLQPRCASLNSKLGVTASGNLGVIRDIPCLYKHLSSVGIGPESPQHAQNFQRSTSPNEDAIMSA